jgi:TonB family protein
VKEAPVKETPVQDPYVVERNSYNRQISKLLIDVTYALQIFRTGMFVQLEVSIDPSGTVVNHKVIKSSGSHDFDDTAIMSLEEIQFAPLPEAMLKYGNYVVILQIQNSR